MNHLLPRIANRLLKPLALEIHRKKTDEREAIPYDFSDLEKSILSQVSPFTMTSPERVAVLVESVRHVINQGIEGDFVECGVWKGGSAMAAALALKSCGTSSRHLWLYDTYEGMSPPTEADVSHDGESARAQMEVQDIHNPKSVWCYSPLEEVRSNLLSTGHPPELLHFVKGRVEDTIPAAMPEKIALLRLDTDWYESTRHELIHLYPRLVSGGVLIVDDYGYWKGSRQAVDEYFEQNAPRPLLVRIDSTARIAIKP